MRQTKIICTIGPACNNKETILKMINAGMDVARFNMSHGDYGELEKTFATVKEAIAESGKNVALSAIASFTVAKVFSSAP